MRFGFTTGSCAASAAKAAAFMLLTGREKTEITVDTPKGIVYHAKLEDIIRQEQCVSCAVRKDGGDDPDITTGALIYASVSIIKNLQPETSVQIEDGADAQQEVYSEIAAWQGRAGTGDSTWQGRIRIDGGNGVGRVTKPGLDQPPGQAAINHVPREMIQKEVEQVCCLLGFNGYLEVIISVPQGEELAQKTFNPRLGILGGISILGTSGIVEPMSSQALLDTIRVELRHKWAQGAEVAAVSPGNYGLDYMRHTYGYDLDASVKCSNFIGDTIDMAAETGFSELLLTGHIGKLIKLSGGIMNTHSKEGDCRMELLAAAGIKAGISAAAAVRILDCIATEEAVRILREEERLDQTMEVVMEKAGFYLNRRAAGRLRIEYIMYSNEYGELAASPGARAMLRKLGDTTLD